MPNDVREPSAVIWSWRREGDHSAAAERASAAAAARKRGLLGSVIGLAVAALVHHFRPTAGIVVAVIALLFFLVAMAAPLTLYRRLTELLDRFAHAVGAVTTWILMTLLYFLFFLPAGLILRGAGKLAITTGFDRRLPTYWTAAGDRPRTAETYRKQF
jgi:hypothetical protein